MSSKPWEKQNISRAKLKAERNCSVSNARTTPVILAGMFFLSACGNTVQVSTSQDTPWQLPDCDVPACIDGKEIVFTGGKFTKGWIHSWDDNNKIQIGSGPDHPQGQIDIEYDDALGQASSFVMSFNNIKSKVPSEIFDCYRINDLQRISWRFDYVDANAKAPDSHMRLIFLAFDATTAKTVADKNITPFGSGHLEILFKGDQLAWVRTFKGHKQLFEASIPLLCPGEIPATSNKERFPDCKGRACEDDFDPTFLGPFSDVIAPEDSTPNYRCNDQLCEPGEEPDEIILQGNRIPQTVE